ncbi:MAG: cytochrome C, partial [Proteobacteria bacterium]|nr:cytochrome C [Pseudomonadota bacterium]
MNSGLRRFALFGLIVISGLFVALWQVLPRTSNQGYQPEQPIPFSHKLHAGTFKIDCRYCHTGAYKSAHATVPSLSTCMNCHSLVYPESKWMKEIKKSYAEGRPVEWVRVHELPDHVHFNHKRHVL